jgi:Ulp1 family protease
MEKITEFIKKYWVWIIVAVLAIYLFYTMKKKKEIEAKAIAMFNQLNSMAAKEKKGAEYTSEKTSLLNLLKNASSKDREILMDLLNGSLTVFANSEKETNKQKARENFPVQVAEMQSGIIKKHGQADVLKFKAKMDKYGFDI